jgi:4-hydroxybenzoate polyprenyltransferase
LDCFSIATGFVLRAVAGGVAADVALSGWFLICTSLGSLWLAVEKRRQELKVLGAEADEHRKSLDKYSMELISRMETVIVPSLVTCYAMYCYFWQGPELTNAPVSTSGWMLMTVPFVLYGIFRYQLLSTTVDVTGSPEEVLLKDRPIQISILLWVLVSAGVVYGIIPDLLIKLDAFVNSYRVL